MRFTIHHSRFTMKVIGLTGGIASGKSLVAGIFRELGAVVIEADQIVREIEQPGTEVLRQIVGAFGKEVLRPDGTLDRKQLANLIFDDASARRRLNRITHPHVRRRIQEEVDRHRASDPDRIVIIDIPLLLDTTGPEAFDLDSVIVVSVDREAQLARLVARDGLTREQALKRLEAQRPLAEKVPEADWVIDNSDTVEETRRQVEALWETLRAG